MLLIRRRTNGRTTPLQRTNAKSVCKNYAINFSKSSRQFKFQISKHHYIVKLSLNRNKRKNTAKIVAETYES